MDASQLPKGQSRERNYDGRPVNEPGIYVHKESGAKYITPDGDEGIIQADALNSPVWNNAWERVGDVPSRTEVLEMRETQLLKDAKAEAAEKKARDARVKAAVDAK